MLYLVLPDGRTEWTPAMRLDDVPESHDVDLTSIDWWEPAEATATPSIVRLALRHGVAGVRGIVIDGWPIVAHQRPALLRQTAADYEVARRRAQPSTDAIDALLEQTSPGWTESSRKIEESIREAERQVAELLEPDPKAELVEHWKRLRGQLPEPL